MTDNLAASPDSTLNLLFDLDGTLTDSAPGIMRSVQYALSKIGIDEQDQDVLRSFVGPPLVDAFMARYGVSLETATDLLRWYRERYFPIGIYESAVYPGIEDMLARLRADGHRLYIATAKPEVMALTVAEHFSLTGYFDGIAGASLDRSRDTKEAVVRYVLDECLGGSTEGVLMVGDRSHDVIGAAAWGIPTVGVRWGYAVPGELEEAGAVAVADTPAQLVEIIRRWGRKA